MTEAARDRPSDPATLSTILAFDAAHRRLDGALHSIQRRSWAVLSVLLGHFLLGALGIAFLVFEAQPSAHEGLSILAICTGWTIFSVGLGWIYWTSVQQWQALQEQLLELERERGALSVALSSGPTGEVLQMLRDWMRVGPHIPVADAAPFSVRSAATVVTLDRRRQRTQASSNEDRA